MYTPPAYPPVPPNPLPPDVLLRKPGTVTTAQVMLWLQFSFLICCGTGGTLGVLFWSRALNLEAFGFREDFTAGLENLAALVTVVFAAVVALVVLLGVLAAKIGAGRRWAQVTTILLMLAAFVSGFLAFYTGFEGREGAPVDGSRLVWALVSLALPLVTLLCLFTGSANQWFRQGGRDPFRTQPPGPVPFPPYR